MPSVAPLVETVISKLEDCTRHTTQTSKLYNDVIHHIRTAELVISRSRALQLKFACSKEDQFHNDIDSFISQLMNQEEVQVVGAAKGPVGKILTEMFSESKVTLVSVQGNLIQCSW